jgi:hypothetical protein
VQNKEGVPYQGIREDRHSAPFFYFDRRGTVSFGGRRRYRLLEFLRHARRPDFFEQPEGHGGIAQSPGCVFQLAENPGAFQDARGRQGSLSVVE